MTKPIINVDELEFTEFGSGENFHAARGPASKHIGAESLGYAVVKLQPGKRAWPYHAHSAIEEMFFVIQGEGTLRHAGKEYPIRTGDFICSPADKDQPHQIINTSDKELAYIALSPAGPVTDVMHYPDSGKYGVWHSSSGEVGDPDNFVLFSRAEHAVDYWDGED